MPSAPSPSSFPPSWPQGHSPPRVHLPSKNENLQPRCLVIFIHLFYRDLYAFFLRYSFPSHRHENMNVHSAKIHWSTFQFEFLFFLKKKTVYLSQDVITVNSNLWATCNLPRAVWKTKFAGAHQSATANSDNHKTKEKAKMKKKLPNLILLASRPSYITWLRAN